MLSLMESRQSGKSTLVRRVFDTLPYSELLALEVKAGFTLSPDYFRQLSYWRGLSGTPAERAYVVYAGATT